MARYWVLMVQGAEEENRGSSPADPVLVMQAMGRRIGYIPAAARLADPTREMPLLIFLSESGLMLAEVADRVNDMLRQRGQAVVMVSEGLKTGDIGESRDSFGHVQYSSSEITVAQFLVNHLNKVGLAARGAARASIPGSRRPAGDGQSWRSALASVGVGLLLLMVLQPLWSDTLPLKGHDTLLHYYRIPALLSLWGRGVCFSRWMPDLMLGYGYPLFEFYPPLSAYILTLTYAVVGQATLAWNLVFSLALVVGGVGMFRAGRDLYGRAGGLLATAAYLLSPPLLLQTFQRGSLSNALAMAFFPLALLTILRAARTAGRRHIAWAAIALASVLVTHLAASLMLVAPLAIVGVITALSVEPGWRRSLRRLGAVGFVLLGGMALAAAVWLPALAEAHFTRYSEALTSPDLHYSHFFAPVLAWPEPALAGLANPPLTLTVGAGQFLLGCLVLALALARLVSKHPSEQPLGVAWVSVALSLTGLGAVYLATPLSSWAWRNSALLRNFQFPFRWLDVAALLLALSAGWLVKQDTTKTWWRAGLIGLGALIFAANALPYVYATRWQSAPEQPTLAQVTEAQMQRGIYGLTSWGEYLPATVPGPPAELPFPGADQGATLDQKLVRGGLPAGAILAASGGPTRAELRVSLPEATALAFYSYYFPGWTATVDGTPVAVGADDAGRLTFAVPPGEHTVSVTWGKTPARVTADAVTLLAALVLGVALLVPARSSKPSPRAIVPEKVNTLADLAVPCGVLGVLLLCKVVWFDQWNSPLVRHAHDGQIPHTITPAWGQFGQEIALAGYRLEEESTLVLYWRVRQPPEQDYAIRVSLVSLTDPLGPPAGEIVNPHPGTNATSRWEPGDLIYDRYALPVDPSQRPIGYYLNVAVIDPVTGEGLELLDAPQAGTRQSPSGRVKLAAPQRLAINLRRDGGIFAEAIEFIGARLPTQVAKGTTLDYTLFFRSLKAVAVDYQVFVHLLDAQGKVVAGNDGPPRQGFYPTSFWSPGEIIADERHWALDVPPGEYQLEVGFYQLSTGERLPLTGQDAQGQNQVLLKGVQVTP